MKPYRASRTYQMLGDCDAIMIGGKCVGVHHRGRAYAARRRTCYRARVQDRRLAEVARG